MGWHEASFVRVLAYLEDGSLVFSEIAYAVIPKQIRQGRQGSQHRGLRQPVIVSTGPYWRAVRYPGLLDGLRFQVRKTWKAQLIA